MDNQAANFYRALWAHQPVPFRPSPLGLQIYEESLSGSENEVLIYGGTPELADLASERDARRVVRIDLSEEILYGMEALAEREWVNTESIAGDWLDTSHEWVGCFDVAWCDGGTLFLQFPDQWAKLFELTYQRLKPGGRFIFKSQSHPANAPGFEEFMEQKMKAFDATVPALDTASRNRALWALVADVWQGCHLGEVNADGSIRKPAVKAQMAKAKERLLAVFPGEADAAIIEQEMNVICNADGTTGLEFLTPPALVEPLLKQAGFTIDSHSYLGDSRPIENYCWQYCVSK